MLKPLLAAALLLLAAPAFACRCVRLADSFAETVRKTVDRDKQLGRPPSLHVVEGEIVALDHGAIFGHGRKGPSMTVLVRATTMTPDPKRVLDGTVITVMGQDGMNCLESLGHFQPGRAYRLALHGGPRDAFGLSWCGVFWETVSPKP